jgi:antitoxin (DNA-binding transcriptional repressor) of toxin-antitoxin stability system
MDDTSEGKEFNPQAYLTKVGGKPYLEVCWRLVWFREKYPEASLDLDMVQHDEVMAETNKGGQLVQRAVFKCRVSVPGGGSAEGYGSETSNDFRDYLEKASTKAIGRALAALGFGTQFSAWEFGGEGERDRPVDAPVKSPQQRQERRPGPAEQMMSARAVGEGLLPDASLSPVPQHVIEQDRRSQQQQQQQQPPPPSSNKATPRQVKWIKDLIAKVGENPDDFDMVLSQMQMDTASEWIKQLQDGVQPWITEASTANAKIVPHPATAPASIEQSAAMMRRVLKLTEAVEVQKEDWAAMIAMAGSDNAKWQNLARSARSAVKYGKKPEAQAWRYTTMMHAAPTKEVLDGLYKMANEDAVYSPDMEQAIEQRVEELHRIAESV